MGGRIESLQPIIQLHTLLGTVAASVESGSVSRPRYDDQLLSNYIEALWAQSQIFSRTASTIVEEKR